LTHPDEITQHNAGMVYAHPQIGEVELKTFCVEAIADDMVRGCAMYEPRDTKAEDHAATRQGSALGLREQHDQAAAYAQRAQMQAQPA